MNRIGLSLAILALMTCSLPALSDPEALEGVVKSIETKDGKKIVHFKTANEDIDLDFAAIPMMQRAPFNAPWASSQILPTRLSPIKSCPASQPLTGFGPIAVSFLFPSNSSIGSPTVQKSTACRNFWMRFRKERSRDYVVTNTKSLHHGAGDGYGNPMSPRVLRSSIDGKITISFVCDPKNPTYGKVETVYFDDKEKEFHTVEWSFGGKGDPVPRSREISLRRYQLRELSRRQHCERQDFTQTQLARGPFLGDCQRDRGITFYGMSDDNMDPAFFRKRAPTSALKQPQGCDEDKDPPGLSRIYDDSKRFERSRKMIPFQ